MTNGHGPLGATWVGNGTHFRVFSTPAERIELCLFDSEGRESHHDMERMSGFMWHVFIPGVGPGQAYGYRVHGPYDVSRGLRCNPAKLLTDPYAKAISKHMEWGQPMYSYPLGGDESAIDDSDSGPVAPKSYVVDGTFDWQNDQSPRYEPGQEVVYELHVKGFTKLHPAVPENLRGTYAGLAVPEVVASIRELGITTIELMPIQHFAHEPTLIEKGLKNYWGYNTFGFFAPHAEYSASDDRGGQVHEFKRMIRSLHAAGLEVILDVVYNHTGEGNHLGPTLSFKGFDNAAYYHLMPDDPRHYMDYTGTGNSVRLRHPYALQLVMDSLRYWVTEMHVDGFRFDLAAALARGAHTVDTWSAFFATVHQDPVLQSVRLIAEPWDTGANGYQVGNFPFHWSEWNDKYRETIRAFWREGGPAANEVACRLTGSAEIFQHTGRGPSASVNYIASHDGLTLRDLAGGDVRMQRNLLATLMTSMGLPMLGAGDEWGRSQQGNDNAYNQDNEISWLDWSKVDEGLRSLVRKLIALRPQLPWLEQDDWPGGDLHIGWIRQDAQEMTDDDWHQPRRHLAMIGKRGDHEALLMLNAGKEDLQYALPKRDRPWQVLIDTSCEAVEPEARQFTLRAGSIAVLRQAVS